MLFQATWRETLKGNAADPGVGPSRLWELRPWAALNSEANSGTLSRFLIVKHDFIYKE